jgi:hypothetical protein
MFVLFSFSISSSPSLSPNANVRPHNGRWVEQLFPPAAGAVRLLAHADRSLDCCCTRLAQTNYLPACVRTSKVSSRHCE